MCKHRDKSIHIVLLSCQRPLQRDHVLLPQLQFDSKTSSKLAVYFINYPGRGGCTRGGFKRADLPHHSGAMDMHVGMS